MKLATLTPVEEPSGLWLLKRTCNLLENALVAKNATSRVLDGHTESHSLLVSHHGGCERILLFSRFVDLLIPNLAHLRAGRP